MRELGRATIRLVCLHKSVKGPANRLREHGKFRSALLLLENDERLLQVQVAAVDFVPQDFNLRVLAAEAQHRRTGNIGMVDVARDQTAEIVRVFPRPATSSLMEEKPDAIHIGKEFRRGLDPRLLSRGTIASSMAIISREFRDLLPILRGC